jgi:hypothetical protein
MRQIFIVLSLMLMTGSGMAQQMPFNYSVRLRPVEITGLPGLHSFAVGQAGGKWLVIGGRKDGLHARQPFNAFPAGNNNTDIYVIDISARQFWSASVMSLVTGLKEQLQSTNMNFYQDGDSLYLIGGYGYSNTALDHVTFPYLTSISVSGLIKAVTQSVSIVPYFKQISDQRFAVTGGQLGKIGGFFFLVGGHRFDGRYNPMGNATYTQTYVNGIRKFSINNSGAQLSFSNYTLITDQVHLHRRDYNLVPQIFPNGEEGYTVSSGVFQTGADLPFLYPVDITASAHIPRPSFNQFLSNYHSAKAALFDSLDNIMHSIFFGGISQYSYINNVLTKDNNVPFVKTISRVSRDAGGNLQENVVPAEMPGLTGAGAEFIPNHSLPHYKSEVIKLSRISDDSVLIGHIFGGIYSPQANPFTANQTSATNAHNTAYEVWLVSGQLTGLKPLNGDNPMRVSVFPNPASSGINFSLELPYETDVDLFITDVHGRIVFDKGFGKLGEGIQTITLSDELDLSRGAYSFNFVFNGEYSAIEKVIIAD